MLKKSVHGGFFRVFMRINDPAATVTKLFGGSDHPPKAQPHPNCFDPLAKSFIQAKKDRKILLRKYGVKPALSKLDFFEEFYWLKLVHVDNSVARGLNISLFTFFSQSESHS